MLSLTEWIMKGVVWHRAGAFRVMWLQDRTVELRAARQASSSSPESTSNFIAFYQFPMPEISSKNMNFPPILLESANSR